LAGPVAVGAVNGAKPSTSAAGDDDRSVAAAAATLAARCGFDGLPVRAAVMGCVARCLSGDVPLGDEYPPKSDAWLKYGFGSRGWRV
jgi:hypothetical protein